jgi:hypothetical protein
MSETVNNSEGKEAKKGDWAGVGRGIPIFELEMYERMKDPKAE